MCGCISGVGSTYQLGSGCVHGDALLYLKTIYSMTVIVLTEESCGLSMTMTSFFLLEVLTVFLLEECEAICEQQPSVETTVSPFMFPSAPTHAIPVNGNSICLIKVYTKLLISLS